MKRAGGKPGIVVRFGFKQTIKAGLIIGVVIGIMMGAQGIGYHAAYPSEASRTAFVKTLEATPSLGFLSGEVANAASPASYGIYKSITLVTLLTAIWGLLAVTRLLRGQEEDGRMELLLAGAISKTKIIGGLLGGFLLSFAAAFLAALVLITLLGRAPGVDLSPYHALLTTVASFLPGLCFAAVGVFVSQLAVTRSRALLYGLAPLLVLFVLRSIGNTGDELQWLKTISPFGWSDLLNPVLHPHLLWLVPSAVLVFACMAIGTALALRRDLGSSLVRQASVVRSRFALLGSSLALAVRRNSWRFVWWAVGAIGFSALLASLANMTVDILKDAAGAQKAITKLGSGSDLATAFMYAGSLFTFLILLVMTIMLFANLRSEEAKGYADNELIQPVSKRHWLTVRTGVLAAMVCLVAIGCLVAMWYIAYVVQDIHAINFGAVVSILAAWIAILVFLIGVGLCMYGRWPRLAVAVLSLIVGWSFILDILRSVFTFSSAVSHTSLLSYIPLSSHASLNVPALAGFVIAGSLLAALGVFCFGRRDIVLE